jgi:hypothetical protein
VQAVSLAITILNGLVIYVKSRLFHRSNMLLCGKMAMRWLIERTQKIPTIEKPFGEPPSVTENTSAILQTAGTSLIFDSS